LFKGLTHSPTLPKVSLKRRKSQKRDIQRAGDRGITRMKIDSLHSQIVSLISTDVTGFNQGFYEHPKTITDEKLPAYAVYFLGHDNDVITNATNKRTYHFAIDVIYDKETIDTSQTVTSDLVSQTIDALEDTDDHTLSGNCDYTLPTKCSRIEDYEIAGKHYLAYQIIFSAVSIETI